MDNRKVILVVDDDKTNLFLAQNLLSATYNVVSVISGIQALKFVGRRKPDLILLDLFMPEMNGFEVIKKLQEDEETKKIPVIFLTGDSQPSTEIKCLELGAADFIVKPFEPKIMFSRIKRVLELESYRNHLEELVEYQTKKISKMQHQVIIGIAGLIECRDSDTGEHVRRTTRYVEILISELKKRNMFLDTLTQNFCDNLCEAAPLHDIGKISVSDSILRKPGKLTAEEFEIIKMHTVEGGKILKEILSDVEEKDFFDVAYQVVYYHHEKWDGSGYPKGISGNDIPLAARIMSLADVFDALASDRCYRNAIRPLDKVFEIIENSAGTHFDPVLTKVFLECREKIEKEVEDCKN